ncbi:MAG TPA: hypothetical protein VKR82_03605 [Candidatus Acidoferrales bacterium]|jgi:hypothetical protein|nr:hypothetical protein [Candidatus Acidoferrales bacterium]
MQADRVEVSWDSAKSKWLVRIEAGDEVLRRPFSAAKNADDQSLRNGALKLVQDEGYQADSAKITLSR